MEIKVYGTNECPYCSSLKRYLSILRVPYHYIDIDLKENEKEYFEVMKKLEHTMIPVIRINDEFLSPDKEFDSITQAVNLVYSKYKKNKSRKI